MSGLVLSASVSTVVLFTLKLHPSPLRHTHWPVRELSRVLHRPKTKQRTVRRVESETVSDFSKDRSSLSSGSLHVLVQAVEVLGLLGPAHADGSTV